LAWFESPELRAPIPAALCHGASGPERRRAELGPTVRPQPPFFETLDGLITAAWIGSAFGGDRKRSLTFYVNFALANYRDPENEKSLKDAASFYVAMRGAKEKLSRLSHRQFKSFR